MAHAHRAPKSKPPPSGTTVAFVATVFRQIGFAVFLITAAVALLGCATGPTPPKAEETAAKDQLPVPLFQPEPVYPILARMAGAEGVIKVGFIITDTGDVANPFILEGENVLLANAALEAVSKWKFSPALKNGKPVAVKTVQELTFSLRDEPQNLNQGPARQQIQVPR